MKFLNHKIFLKFLYMIFVRILYLWGLQPFPDVVFLSCFCREICRGNVVLFRGIMVLSKDESENNMKASHMRRLFVCRKKVR